MEQAWRPFVHMNPGLTPERLSKLINDDEGVRLEFKAALLPRSDIGDYAVALGNEGGGYLISGISNDRPRRIIGLSSVTTEELQKIRSAVLDYANVRVEAYLLVLEGKSVLCIEIPSRLRGQVFHTKTGKYLMRSGEALRGMTPVEIDAILAEARSLSTAEAKRAKELVELAEKNSVVRLTPGVPAQQAFDFRVASADERSTCVVRTASSQEVVIPTNRIAEILWLGNGIPVVQLAGRVQWITARCEWQFFPELPITDSERQFGFFTTVGHQSQRVLDICKYLQGLGHELRWFNESQLVRYLGKDWDIFYDVDGHYFKVADPRMNQILAIRSR